MLLSFHCLDNQIVFLAFPEDPPASVGSIIFVSSPPAVGPSMLPLYVSVLPCEPLDVLEEVDLPLLPPDVEELFGTYAEDEAELE